jgi:hypothetical protein
MQDIRDRLVSLVSIARIAWWLSLGAAEGPFVGPEEEKRHKNPSVSLEELGNFCEAML